MDGIRITKKSEALIDLIMVFDSRPIIEVRVYDIQVITFNGLWYQLWFYNSL